MFDQLLQNLRRYILLTDEEASLLTSKLELRKLRKKQWLVTPGDYCRSEHYINKGCFRAYCIDENGAEHITKLSIEDWWITDLEAFLTGNPAKLYIEAIEDSEVIVFRKNVVEELYEEVPQLNKYFRLLYQLALANNLQRLHRTISNTAEEHYLQFLQQFPLLEQRVPQYMIASYLGITPEFLSKIRRRLGQKT